MSSSCNLRAIVACVWMGALVAPAIASEPPWPKLIVAISIDQFPACTR